MYRLKCVFALTVCGALSIAAPVQAEPLNGCATFYDPAQRDRDAKDVFVSIETFNKKTFEEEAACFLVPRVVLDRKLRSGYADGRPNITMLAFDPADLLGYVKDRQSIGIVSEERTVDLDQLGCLADPAPDWIAVVSRYVVASPTPTIEEISAYAKEIATDVPGYHRYTTLNADFYLLDPHPGSQVSFWCRQDMCRVVRDYDEFATVATYPKVDMTTVQPEKALQCFRAVAELFRLR
ncbi:MAG TPA: hypothetical protein VGQ35_21350 [Dongiaceae bacterium]|jgi:hypothetical protein|nr:hypothetical protein [Dongiaceae bacterium]